MTFLAPGWIALGAIASIAVAAIHLIAWRLPRAMVLPTARFVPDEPARRAARTLRPADLVLLALRVAILMAGGIAMARPVLDSAPSGVATVVTIERADFIGGATGLRDRLGSTMPSGVTAFVVYDTVASTFANEADAIAAATQGRGPRASLTVGLVAAIREARSLSRDFESVRIVVASPFESGAFDNATRDVRATWHDSISLVRVPVIQRPTRPVRVDMPRNGDDAVAAGIRLALANAMLRGESRLIRGVASAEDTSWADSGRALILWPRAGADAVERVDGVHASGYTAIGHFIPGALDDSGRVVARWVSGHPAARESVHRSGCVRTVGFDISDVGDLALTPAFQRLLSVLVGPCDSLPRLDLASDSAVAALAAAPADTRAIVRHVDNRLPNRLASSILALAVLMALLELRVRRLQGTRVAALEPGA